MTQYSTTGSLSGQVAECEPYHYNLYFIIINTRTKIKCTCGESVVKWELLYTGV